MDIQIIKKLAAETRQRLAALAAGSGDIDEIARKRVFEREKLHLLAEQEAAETQRLEAQRIVDRDKARAALAKKFRSNAERDLAEDNRLTAEAVTALRTCIAALAARHTLWTPDGIGLLSDEAQAAFTRDEHRHLADALCRSFRPVHVAEFSTAVREALAGASPDAQDSIRRLFANPPNGIQRAEAPTARRSAPLIDVARGLQDEPYPLEQPSAAPVAAEQPEAAGPRFEVDLRPTGNGDDGPRTTREAAERRNVELGPTRCVNGDVTRPPRHQVVG